MYMYSCMHINTQTQTNIFNFLMLTHIFLKQTQMYVFKDVPNLINRIIYLKKECLSNVCTKYKYSIPQTESYIHIHTLNTSIQSHKQIHIFIYTHLIWVFNLTNRYIYSYTPTQYEYSISQTDTYIHIHPLNTSIQSHKQIHIFIYTHSIWLFNLTNRYIYTHTHITQTIILFKVECLSNVFTKFKYSIPQTDTYIHKHTQHNTNHKSV